MSQGPGCNSFSPQSGQQTHSSQITKSSLIVLRKAEEEFEKRSSPQRGKKLWALSADLANRRAKRSRELEVKRGEMEVLFNHKMLRSCLQTYIQIIILASNVTLQNHGEWDTFCFVTFVQISAIFRLVQNTALILNITIWKCS